MSVGRYSKSAETNSGEPQVRNVIKKCQPSLYSRLNPREVILIQHAQDELIMFSHELLCHNDISPDVTKTGNGEWGMGNGEWGMGN